MSVCACVCGFSRECRGCVCVCGRQCVRVRGVSRVVHVPSVRPSLCSDVVVFVRVAGVVRLSVVVVYRRAVVDLSPPTTH